MLRPSLLDSSTPYELLCEVIPNIADLWVFGCKVLVPIPPPQRTKMGPQRRLGIYIGFVSPSIIQYLEPSTGNLLRARFADCVFDELNFSSLEGVHDKRETSEFFCFWFEFLSTRSSHKGWWDRSVTDSSFAVHKKTCLMPSMMHLMFLNHSYLQRMHL